MIQKERIRLTYPWIKIKNEIDEILYELSIAEDEEESQIYLLRLHLENREDLEFFTAEEKQQIKSLLQILSMDAARHRELLEEMMKEIRESGEVENES